MHHCPLWYFACNILDLWTGLASCVSCMHDELQLLLDHYFNKTCQGIAVINSSADSRFTQAVLLATSLSCLPVKRIVRVAILLKMQGVWWITIVVWQLEQHHRHRPQTQPLQLLGCYSRSHLQLYHLHLSHFWVSEYSGVLMPAASHQLQAFVYWISMMTMLNLVPQEVSEREHVCAMICAARLTCRENEWT